MKTGRDKPCPYSFAFDTARLRYPTMIFFAPGGRMREKLKNHSLCGGLLGILVLSTACASPIYKVAPVPHAPAPEATTGSAGGLEVTAAAMTDERAIAQMDANLPLAGLIAVEVKISNQSSAAIPGKTLRALLHSPNGKALSPMEPKKALQQVMKYYGVRLYGKEAYARTIESYESVALQLEQNIAPAESVHGVLFFDAKAQVKSTSGYRLTIEGGSGPISVQLN
jgi:hypothetical protein